MGPCVGVGLSLISCAKLSNIYPEGGSSTQRGETEAFMRVCEIVFRMHE